MRAMVLDKQGPIGEHPLALADLPRPVPGPGEVLLKVRACGVCRTDLHIVEGDLPLRLRPVVPGHQIVGEVVDGETAELPRGVRVGVSWMGGVDGTCPYCRIGAENLCDRPDYTGYTRNGGYAEYVTARADFLHRLPDALDDLQAAPLLCAGIIGFRSLRMAEVKPGTRVGLFGFGASAHLAIQVLHAWDCRVYVSTRGEAHQEFARTLGAEWVGAATEQPPEPLDSAVTFAPAGEVALAALKSLRKGGVAALNAIHMSPIPPIDFDHDLWGERQLRSVTNMTRQDAHDFLELAAKIGLRPRAEQFRLEDADSALERVRNDALDGAAVLIP
jgi:propanol-preferring alcohol dehydrogenase